MQIIEFLRLWLVEVIIVTVILLAIFVFIFLVSRVEKIAKTTLRKAAEDKKLADNAIKAARDIAAIAGEPHLAACLNEIETTMDGLLKRIVYLHTAIVKKTGFLTARTTSREIQQAGRQMKENADDAQQTSKDVIKNAQKTRHDKTTNILMRARAIVDKVTELAHKSKLVAGEQIIVTSSFSEMAVELSENIESIIPQLKSSLKALVDRAPTATPAQLARELAPMEDMTQPAYKHWESLLTMRDFAHEEKEEVAQIIITAPALASAIRKQAESLEPHRNHSNHAMFQEIDRCVANGDWLATNIVQAAKAREMPQARQWLEQLYDIEGWLRRNYGR